MKRIFVLFLTIFIAFALLPVGSFCEEDIAEPAEEVFAVEAPFAVITNADTGTELYAKNADSAVFCGFLPRLMTCVLLLESELELQSEILLTREMMAVSHDKSSADLVSGDRISLYDLLKCIIVGNSQEACIAVAVTVAGSVTDFVVKMNLRARELGAENTTFTNVTGQYVQNTKQLTTARDIAKICAHVLRLDYIEDFSNSRYVEINVNGALRSLFTKNSLIDKNSLYYCKKASGLAISGNTTTGFALASVAVEKTMRIISVAITYSGVSDLYAEMTDMIDFSLNEYTYRVLVTKNAPVKEIPVVFGKERDHLTLVADKTITASLPSSVPDSAIVTEAVIPESINAPVAKGTILGTVTFSYDGNVYGTTDLIAQTDISLDVVASYTNMLEKFFTNKYLIAAIITVFIVVVFYSTIVFIINRRKMKRAESKKRDRITKTPK